MIKASSLTVCFLICFKDHFIKDEMSEEKNDSNYTITRSFQHQIYSNSPSSVMCKSEQSLKNAVTNDASNEQMLPMMTTNCHYREHPSSCFVDRHSNLHYYSPVSSTESHPMEMNISLGTNSYSYHEYQLPCSSDPYSNYVLAKNEYNYYEKQPSALMESNQYDFMYDHSASFSSMNNTQPMY